MREARARRSLQSPADRAAGPVWHSVHYAKENVFPNSLKGKLRPRVGEQTLDSPIETVKLAGTGPRVDGIVLDVAFSDGNAFRISFLPGELMMMVDLP